MRVRTFSPRGARGDGAMGGVNGGGVGTDQLLSFSRISLLADAYALRHHRVFGPGKGEGDGANVSQLWGGVGYWVWGWMRMGCACFYC